ncbi:MAG: Nif3-like dinuclear metal center hexameric protein [Porphyromonas sp.]|nr:Nif3-like dinuclear metal center hexameric protein [Porphyromonas sp.]
MKIKELLQHLEQHYPLALQESWDNSGLQLGDPEQELSGVLVAIDATEAVIEEALEHGCNLIVTHHPLLFHPLKRISNRTYVERTVQMVLRNDLVLYAAHTNLDNSPRGINAYWGERMGLQNMRALAPLEGHHYKVVTYISEGSADELRRALMEAGIGRQGQYDGTSFSVRGEGRFRPQSGAHPHVGEQGVWHMEPEVMVTSLCAKVDLARALHVIRKVHPYEEPAIDVVPIMHQDPNLGGGVVGDLPEPVALEELFDRMKAWQPIHSIAHSKVLKDPVQRIAYGGGACREYIHAAASAGADLFITGEAKYNDYYDAMDLVTLVTIGHYESEYLSEDILYNTLSQKNGTFAVRRASSSMNPISYR